MARIAARRSAAAAAARATNGAATTPVRRIPQGLASRRVARVSAASGAEAAATKPTVSDPMRRSGSRARAPVRDAPTADRRHCLLANASQIAARGTPCSDSFVFPILPRHQANLVATVASEAVATEVVATPVAPNGGDSAWMMTSAALVLAMNIPGLSMFYGGLVGERNVLSIFTTCMMFTCVMSLMWFGCGYSLAFTGDNPIIGNFSKAFLKGVSPTSLVDGITEPLWAMFQCTFAVITPGLIIGAMAERMKFSAVLVFSIFWSFLVYYPFAHMVWGGGLMEQLGAIDFAGGIVVHLTAGAAALLACIMVGPRKAGEQPPHNMPMVLIGTGALWVGWFGFNAGSAVAANGIASMAMVTTQIAAATAGLGWALLDWMEVGKPTAIGLCCGVVAGLVCVTPGAGFVSPLGAFCMGAIAAVICRFSCLVVKRTFGYDDALDVWGVHGVGGLLGNELTAIFGTTAFGGTEAVASVSKLFLVHTACSLGAIVWSMAVTFVLLKIIGATIGLRPADEDEILGLDLHDHGEKAYQGLPVY